MCFANAPARALMSCAGNEAWLDSLSDDTAKALPEKKSHKKKWKQSKFYKFLKSLNEIDTTYVTPNYYNFTAMVQQTCLINAYSIRGRSAGSDKQQINFYSKPRLTLGPYIGWHWIFLGYNFDIARTYTSNKSTQFNLSVYSSAFGADLIYQKNNGDYTIGSVKGFGKQNDKIYKDVKFDGLKTSIKSLNVYYIFNHKRFSYPAAFSQSTVQRRSCGSPMIGIGYTKHTLSIDWQKLNTTISNILGSDVTDKYLDKNVISGKIKYTDVSISGGYGYNWVFARNWLFASSLSLALGYKHTTSDVKHENFSLRDFSIRNINIDGVGRFGIVWNNTKWYFGASTILHSYNYRKKQFSTNNFFGSLNIYIGFNFDRK